jgi:acyl-CoA thioesterase FadM
MAGVLIGLFEINFKIERREIMDFIKEQAISLKEEEKTETGILYEYSVRVTFCMTNAEGNVGHDVYAQLFGQARELFGMDCIPNFANEAGKLYLLKTKSAFYKYFKDFFFGDTILIKMRISEVGGAYFIIKADFVNPNNGEIHAFGEQKIVYTGLDGRPRRIHKEFRKFLEGLKVS